MRKIPLTRVGADALKVELGRLKIEDRPQIIQAITEARSHGDLKENAEYHAARERQSFTEGRIEEIESVLSQAQIIDVMQLEKTGRIVFGTTVVLLDEDDNEVSYQIVGNDEADIKAGKISVNSPIARALIGKVKGDEVLVQAPAGEKNYEITEVLYL